MQSHKHNCRKLRIPTSDIVVSQLIMVNFVTYYLLVILCRNLVSTDNVLEWTPLGTGTQLTFPWHTPEKLELSKRYTMSSSSGEPYSVICRVYTKEDPMVNVYTKEGILVDTLALSSYGSNPCDENQIKNYVIPQNPEKGKVKMMYLWAGNYPVCVLRSYKIDEYAFMAMVERFDYPHVACPAEVTEWLKTNFPEEHKNAAGGVVSVALMEKEHIMDYTSHLLRHAARQELIFPEKDPRGKFFKLVCQEDTLTAQDPVTGKNTILTGSVVHEDNIDIVMEKFKLASCDVSNINVNRRIQGVREIFKAVFKTNKGVCYEREYEYFSRNFLHYFNEFSVVRRNPIKVKCPNKFTGDINMNKPLPSLLLRLFYMIFGIQYKDKPFSVDIPSRY